jgi:hypothetical protein
MKHLVLIAIASMAATQFAHAQYTFGSEVQTTPSASIAYNSGTGLFQYTDATNTQSASAYLPLAGSAAAFITTSNGWTASINASLATNTLIVSGGVDDPHTVVFLRLQGVDTNKNSIAFMIQLVQMNNTAGGDTSDFPLGFYGSAVRVAGGNYLPTPLGNAFAYSNNVYTGGDCAILPLAAGTNATSADVSVGATNGMLTLTYEASTTFITAYYNQEPVAETSIAGWSQLMLCVGGGDKEVGATNGSIIASNFFAGLLPALTIIRSDTNVVLTWSTNASAFTLQSTTNLSPAAWRTNLPAPVVLNGQYTVTNPISSTQRFYKLSQ